jgi:formate C-acetyltransferase
MDVWQFPAICPKGIDKINSNIVHCLIDREIPMIKTQDEHRTSERIWQLREEIMKRKGSFVKDANPFERDVAMLRAGKNVWNLVNDSRSVVQIRAARLLELVKIATIRIYPDWCLAGEHLPHDYGIWNPQHEEFADRVKELNTKLDDIKYFYDRWQHRLSCETGELDPETAKGGPSWSITPVVFMSLGWIEQHSCRDYAKVLRIGFKGILQEIETRMSQAQITDPNYPQQENFWKAAKWVCEAGILLGKRYAELARSMGKEEMAAACDRVPAEGARTLFEATQSLWLAHILTCGEDGINANSIGRLDQILYPYYKADIEAGRITRQEAVELMEELACKMYLDYDVQAITLGGVDRQGKDAVNEMSYIILEATRNVDFIRDVCVRITPETPKKYVDLCASLVVKGGGIPFFFNDNCFIKAMSDRGITMEDAREYAPIGCVELTIPGKANPHAVSGWINAAKCLELALFDGKDPRTGEQIGPHTGLFGDLESYEDLMANFRTQLEYFTKNMVYRINVGELAQRERGPLPCWSVLTDDCIERGRDITNEGALYSYHSICFLGTANCADSLMAIKKLVFEEKKIERNELLEALRTNFEGNETMRQMLLNGASKYGNDIDEVDDIAAGVTNYFLDLMDQYRTPLNGRYFVHLFSFVLNIGFGKTLGAMPDGRKAGEPVAYSLSAQQGRDEKGVTAILNTLAKLPHDRAAGGSAAIIDIDPKLMEGEAGVERLSQIVRSAIRMGVGQMQFNVVTAEKLRQAKTDPEHYGNIPVRVAGYSQMFKLLNEDLQEHVIARTKHVTG